MHRHIAALLTAISLALLLPGCSKPETPEQRLRALINGAEQAAEQKEIGTLRGYVSDRYRDAAGRDRRTIDGVLRLYLLRHANVHLLTRVERVTLTPPDRADAVIYVAMAARPIASAEALAAFQANLYRFDIGFLEEEEQWRVTHAAWRPAELADFIYQPKQTP